METPTKRKVTKVVQSHASSAPSSPRARVTAHAESRRPPSRPASPTKPRSHLSPAVIPKARVKSDVSSGALAASELRKAPSVPFIRNTNTPPRKTVNAQSTASQRPIQAPLVSHPQKSSASPASQVSANVRSSSQLNAAQSPWSPSDWARSRATLQDSPSIVQQKEPQESGSLTSLSTLFLRSRSSSLASSDLLSVLDLDKHADPSPMRIKAKVSSLAKNVDAPPPIPHLNKAPHFATLGRRSGPHSRTPSINRFPSAQSQAPPSPPEQVIFYPITTATPAANPHRFVQNRHEPRKPSIRHTLLLDNGAANAIEARSLNVAANVDPTAIPLPSLPPPLPPHSPPSSSLSFSSRSSGVPSSLSSGEGANTVPSRSNCGDARTFRTATSSGARLSLDGFLRDIQTEPAPAPIHEGSPVSSIGSAGGPNDSIYHQVRAEAKSNRKIADLEITNRSLLAINSSLETTKHRQAKEIRELRRKLRESRLILPPLAYRAISHDDEIEADDEDDKEEEEGAAEGQNDQAYLRVKALLDGLLEGAKRALEATSADLLGGSKGGAKVLSAEEVRVWGGLEADHDLEMDDSLQPSPVAILTDGDELLSEEEVEALVIEPDSPPAPFPSRPHS